jgi:L-asparaginase
MRRYLTSLALLLSLSVPAPSWAQTQPATATAAAVPRVRLVATGGTISNRAGARLSAEELVKLIPGIERYAQPEFEQFSNLASSRLTLDQRLALARRMNEIVATDAGIAGLVATSGIDTLAELAYS